MKFDFGGWATKNNLQCSDGRVIRENSFMHNDGQKVPLVWNHRHEDTKHILGHALLKNLKDGVYAYGFFNDTPEGKRAKELVVHGDIDSLSIYANQIRQNGKDVLHGNIREVSLVLAGANPEAYIDTVIAHSDGCDNEEAIISTGDCIHFDDDIIHSDEKVNKDNDEEPEKDKAANENQKKNNTNEKTIGDVIDSMTEEQKNVMYSLIGQAIEDAKNTNTNGGNEDMKHNLFENIEDDEVTLSHSDIEEIFETAKRNGSLKDTIKHAASDYGIENIDWLFPDAQKISNEPGFIKRNPDAWVNVVMQGVHHTPFSRIKMLFADLREDDARAKGYAQKGKLKKEEVFGLLKRTITPTTVYKKQKLDRDDIVDITDFNVVAWLKSEMRMMLDEEIARAIVFGDGRSAMADDKISEANIIPIVNEQPLYKLDETPDSNAPKDIIRAAVKGQNNYEGSGNTTMFIRNSDVTDMLLIEDTNQHRLYKDMNELALACSVNRIVKVPDSIVPDDVTAVIVDLADYNVGADKGGAVNMFDDFDIDYNQEKYLIETRCSGGLTKPFSAVVVKKIAG